MEESTKTELIKSTTEIVKTAYEDAFQPVAQETGKALGTLGKTVNVALSPLRGVVWGYEQIEEFIHDKVAKKLEEKGAKAEDIITPDPDVAVPAIEALRYSKLKDQFANLLAAAMDSNVSKRAHPSFVEILKQMSLVDAKVVQNLVVANYIPIIEFHKTTPGTPNYEIAGIVYGYKLTALQMAEREVFHISIDNLIRLGIIEVDKTVSLSEDEIYDEIRNSVPGKYMKKSIPTERYVEVKAILRVTDFGKSFRDICI